MGVRSGHHFKNAVISALQRALGAHHQFTTPRCPWANGTVEVLMREVLRCARALLSDWRLSETEWPKVIKIEQLVLNHSPSHSLGGVAPITAMTGLPAMNTLDPVVTPVGTEAVSLEQLREIRGAKFEELCSALEALHKRITVTSNVTRRKGRAKARKHGAKMAQFAICDYVLYADVWSNRRSKLRVKWCGPARVVGTPSNWVFTIENRLASETKEAHASRHKFYADASLNVTEDLLAQVAHNSEGTLSKHCDTKLKARCISCSSSGVG
ncbi:unnamed protein product [Phytophthora fragariaefolia]|uniref:Unnamed protein product n=1 Tax=Phytophthora fragariaefolia TaxID=1490495 RepID=A0A9W6U236_9STRA|nr:unnamed protein product [Phytophthora fragariaefolia]